MQILCHKLQPRTPTGQDCFLVTQWRGHCQRGDKVSSSSSGEGQLGSMHTINEAGVQPGAGQETTTIAWASEYSPVSKQRARSHRKAISVRNKVLQLMGELGYITCLI